MKWLLIILISTAAYAAEPDISILDVGDKEVIEITMPNGDKLVKVLDKPVNYNFIADWILEHETK